MIISQTPVRISFLGGGTDYPNSVLNFDKGLVVGTTINKYSFITCRRLPAFFDYKTRLTYSKIEMVKNNEEIEHRPIKAVIKYLGLNDVPLEISHMSDLPGSSGTGSSSTFIVGLVNALSTLKDDKLSAYELYKCANHIEQGILGDSIGYQDEAWAAFGGINAIEFTDYGRARVQKIAIRQGALDYFNNTLMMFYTGISRIASNIAAEYTITLLEKEKEHRQLIKLAEDGIKAIENGRFFELGRMMTTSWDIKRSLSQRVTNPEIDAMFNTGIEAGAVGGKLMGAGGGGCLIFSVPPERREDVEIALVAKGAIHIPFEFEPDGSKIIFRS